MSAGKSISRYQQWALKKEHAWKNTHAEEWWQIIIGHDEWFVEAAKSDDGAIAVYWCDRWVENYKEDQ